MAWSSGLSLKGERGSQLVYTQGAPGANDGFNGDSAIDVKNGRLYAQKANGAWPTTYASLIGPDGASVRVGTGTPSSSNPAKQADGDVFIQTDAANGPALWGPRASGSWLTSSTSLAGAAGKSILSGDGPPTASVGVDGQPGYLDYTNSIIYGAKANGAWPSSGTSVRGARGSNFSFGTDNPGLTYMLAGDVYFRTTTQQLYYKVTSAAPATTADYPNGWQIIGNLKGDTGAASTVPGPQGSPGSNGLSVVSNTAAPTANDGVVGSPAFINTTAGTLYGAKTSSGWPTSFLSLVGSKGDTGATGPASPGLYSGTGVPTSTNPSGTQVVGSYYLRTDVTPALLYGPLTASGWSSTAQNTGGSQTQYGYGPPASTLGAQGDVYYDLNGLFYPPKTSNGWTLTPINQVGPTGAPGPTTSYRCAVKCELWPGSQTYAANTAYNFVIPLNTAGNSYGVIPLVEPMPAAGSVNYATLYCPGSVAGGTMTAGFTKNGSVVTTKAAAIVCNTSATLSIATAVPSATVSFAANDYIGLQGTFTVGGNQCVYATLYYTLNS